MRWVFGAGLFMGGATAALIAAGVTRVVACGGDDDVLGERVLRAMSEGVNAVYSDAEIEAACDRLSGHISNIREMLEGRRAEASRVATELEAADGPQTTPF